MYRSTKQKALKRGSLSAVVVISVLATGVGLSGIAGASTHTPTKAHSAGAVPLTGPLAGTSGSARDDGPGGDPGIGGPGIGGTVTAVSATSVTVEDRSGTATNYTIDSSTTFLKGPSTVTAADLKVGEKVRIRPTTTGATTAAAVEIDLAHAAGKVVSVSGNSIVVTGRGAHSETITVSGSTTYSRAGANSSLASVTVGSFVFAQGLGNPSHTTLNASIVGIGQPIVGVMGEGPLAGGSGPKGPAGGPDNGAW
jgi:hypothetical protein